MEESPSYLPQTLTHLLKTWCIWSLDDVLRHLLQLDIELVVIEESLSYLPQTLTHLLKTWSIWSLDDVLRHLLSWDIELVVIDEPVDGPNRNPKFKCGLLLLIPWSDECQDTCMVL